MKETKRAAIYTRVSTARQDQDGYSIPLQTERLESYCTAMGWSIAGEYSDPGYSGASINRPGLYALIEDSKSHRFDVVLVYKLDRLSRSQRDTLFLIEDVFEASGVSFVSLQESFDTSSIYGRAMLGIISVFGQMERETITERTLMGRVGRAESGLWHGGGTPPIGYDYIDGHLVINEGEAAQVQRIYKMFDLGFSLREISDAMAGAKTKHGDWSHSATIGNVLDSQLYAGYIKFCDSMVMGTHDPIVDQALNDRVKRLREKSREFRSRPDSNYLLTGLIYCASCGARYFPNRRPNGSVVYSCYSRAKKNKSMVMDPDCKAPHIPMQELDDAVEGEFLFRLKKHDIPITDVTQGFLLEMWPQLMVGAKRTILVQHTKKIEIKRDGSFNLVI